MLGINLIDRFIFFPEAELLATPAHVSLAYEEVWFAAPDGVRLHGWYVPGRRAETLLWLHGNAGNISHRLANLRLLHDHVGVSIFLFDYRQYGRSEGTASEEGLYADARGALAYLRGRDDVVDDRIVYFGRSLGSAIAIDLATSARPWALIVETPFTSLREMAGRMLPGPLSLMVPARFDNLSKIETIKCPVLFIHGDLDDIVPYTQGRRLFEAASPPKAFFTVRGAGHNDTYIVGGSTYFARIRDFIDAAAHDD
jgi:fermentation-respiration switch protein FrsA (DUF1100 family)